VILVLGTIRIPTGSLDIVRPAMATMIDASRREDGCLAYTYSLDVLDNGLIHVVEKWRDRAALNAHFTTAHLMEWRQRFGQLGITDRNLRLFEITEGEVT
jgi:quinol monooxygenase YgiN